MQSVRRFPQYWGRWFASLGDDDVKETNLNIFYHLGAAISSLYAAISIDKRVLDAFSEVYFVHEWITTFLRETEEFGSLLKDSRISAKALLNIVQRWVNDIQSGVREATTFTQKEVSGFLRSKEQLESDFERECRSLPVFTVTPKGLYDTRLLIEKGEEKFPERARAVFTPLLVNDLRQAAKCLAFDVPTAMAFHVMRATESLIKRYYEVIAKNPWPYAQRDWGRYIAELEKLPSVNKVITSRLTEIQKLNRNPLIHPEEIIPTEEAPVIFDLCNGVIYYMAEEIRKLSPP